MVFTLVEIRGFDHGVASPPFVILERRPPLQAVGSRQGLSLCDGHIFNPDHRPGITPLQFLQASLTRTFAKNQRLSTRPCTVLRVYKLVETEASQTTQSDIALYVMQLHKLPS